jgi:hypothetical protein
MVLKRRRREASNGNAELPRALPAKMKRMMRGVKRWVVNDACMVSPPAMGLSPEVIKKTFTPGMDAWIKVLLAGTFCPGSRVLRPS